jgi:hypothetical protein
MLFSTRFWKRFRNFGSFIPPLLEMKHQPLGYHEALNEQVFVFEIYCQHKVEGQNFLNLATEQCSSPQSCTIRPETSTGQSSLGGIYHLVVRNITYFPTRFWSSLGLPLRFDDAQQISCERTASYINYDL